MSALFSPVLILSAISPVAVPVMMVVSVMAPAPASTAVLVPLAAVLLLLTFCERAYDHFGGVPVSASRRGLQAAARPERAGHVVAVAAAVERLFPKIT